MAKYTWQTEGFRGFYRGYVGFMMAITFWVSALPVTTEVVMSAIPYLTESAAKRREQYVSGAVEKSRPKVAEDTEGKDGMYFSGASAEEEEDGDDFDEIDEDD